MIELFYDSRDDIVRCTILLNHETLEDVDSYCVIQTQNTVNCVCLCMFMLYYIYMFTYFCSSLALFFCLFIGLSVCLCVCVLLRFYMTSLFIPSYIIISLSTPKFIVNIQMQFYIEKSWLRLLLTFIFYHSTKSDY